MDGETLTTNYKSENALRAFLKERAVHQALSKTDDDRRIWPYMNFFHCLSDQEAAIEKILEVIASAEAMKKQAAIKLEAKPRTSPDLNEIWDEMRLENDAIGQEEVQDIFAGTLFVLLNNLLWSMAKRVERQGGKKVPDKAGRVIGKTTLFELIRSGGNNFRHYEQWSCSGPKDDQMAWNVAVLEAAGLKAPWDRNLCGDIFRLTGWQSRDELSLEIRKLASEIFQLQTGLPL